MTNCMRQDNQEDFKKIKKEPRTKQDDHKDFKEIAKEPWTIQDDLEDLRIIFRISKSLEQYKTFPRILKESEKITKSLEW